MDESRRWTIEVVCTDRGQHKRTWMTRFIWEPEELDHPRGPWRWRSFIPGEPAVAHDMYGPPFADAEPGSGVSREAYGFCCSRCSRWPKVGLDRWLALIDGARRVGMTEFDVSRLD